MPTHITKEDRKAIDYYLRCRWSQSNIARVLGRGRDVISKEITRNGGSDGVYRYGAAHQHYLDRRRTQKRRTQKITQNVVLQACIETMLKEELSPEQIAGRLRLEQGHAVVCHETTYQWIYTHRPDLETYLCFQKNKYRRRRGTKKRTKKRRNTQFRPIEERPVIVEARERLGDFEGDTIIGAAKTQRILTHVDRKSGYGFADLLLSVSAPIVEEATVRQFAKLPAAKKHTITYDRGSEFGGDDSCLERRTHTMVYRARAYHSWQRGSSENFNGLLRRFYPKGTDFATLTQRDVEQTIAVLNHRPRKRLGYLSPHEVFVRELDVVAFQSRM